MLRRFHEWAVFAGLLLLLAGTASGHPVPDIPVRGYFEEGGGATIRVEVDPRCFAEDPEKEPYLLKWVVDEFSDEEGGALLDQARKLVRDSIMFELAPQGRVIPEFQFRFTSHDAKPLEKDGDPVVLTGEWRTTLPEGTTGWRIEAVESMEFAVPFINHLGGKPVERVAVLFPGEKSFVLDLRGYATGVDAENAGESGATADAGEGAAAGRMATFGEFLRLGFVHVLPDGLDHILFVTGLFLLSRKWRPLLYQVSAFTAAHTLTLFLSTFGWISLPPSIVEPVIAASIAYVAVENIWRGEYNHWRLALVFGFGLAHGLGFAGVLSDYHLAPATLVIGLVAFNVGVEFGQLAVIALAFGATFGLRDPDRFRRLVTIPGSALIGLAGLWWTVQRVFVL